MTGFLLPGRNDGLCFNDLPHVAALLFKLLFKVCGLTSTALDRESPRESVSPLSKDRRPLGKIWRSSVEDWQFQALPGDRRNDVGGIHSFPGGHGMGLAGGRESQGVRWIVG